jgi:ATP-dependent exoDNAse (exonuclease V) beta subunit
VTIFLATTQSPRKHLASKALLKQFPFFDCVLKAEQQRLLELTNFMKRQRVFEVSKAILHLTLAIHRTYQWLKGEKAFIDYDSLITFAIGLIYSPQGVIYKLVDGLDHFFIDGAQDTSPD